MGFKEIPMSWSTYPWTEKKEKAQTERTSICFTQVSTFKTTSNTNYK